MYRPDRRFSPENGLPPKKKEAKPQNVRSASSKKIDAVERPFCHLHKKNHTQKPVHWHISQGRAV
jgi:hypothetical protein